MCESTKTPPLSKRASGPSSTVIRDLLKLAAKPEIISFAGGLPSPKSFPVEGIEKCAVEVLRTQGAQSLQYSATEGEKALREAVAQYETSKGVETVAENVQIVSGSQQALELLGLAFIDEGSTIAVESPTYMGALQAFKMYGPKFLEIPTDEEGLRPDLIDEKFRGIRFAYVMPTFQNPTGLTISEERRKMLAEKAREYDFWIIEDNPYGDLWYDKKPPLSMRAYAPERTLTLGTFSKILAPGFRLGYITGPKAAIEPMTMLKQSVDLHTATFTQLTAAKYVESGMLEEHMPEVRDLYRTQCRAMLNSLETYMPKEVSWSKPEGGMFIWVTVPDYIDTADLMKEAIDRKVAYVPGSAFYANEPEHNRMRLSFVTVPTDKIVEGVRALAEVIESRIRR